MDLTCQNVLLNDDEKNCDFISTFVNINIILLVKSPFISFLLI